MKQKYQISFNPETEALSIQEFAELEKGEFAFVCEEIHDAKVFRDVMDGGAECLVPIVRRPNMYPREEFGVKIALGIIALLSDGSGMTYHEVMIDDVDAFSASENDIDPRIVYKEGDDNDLTPGKANSEKGD